MALDKALEGELVMLMFDDGKPLYYPHAEFVGAFGSIFLDRFADLVPQDASSREAFASVSKMATKDMHQAVLMAALDVLQEQGHPATADEGRVVAVFPARRSSRRIST